MLTLGALLLIACLGGMFGGWAVPKLRIAGLIASTALVGVTAWVIWWGLLFFQVVRIDPMLRRLNIYRLHSITRALVFLGPPLVTAAAFAAVASGRRRREQRNGGGHQR